MIWSDLDPCLVLYRHHWTEQSLSTVTWSTRPLRIHSRLLLMASLEWCLNCAYFYEHCVTLLLRNVRYYMHCISLACLIAAREPVSLPRMQLAQIFFLFWRAVKHPISHHSIRSLSACVLWWDNLLSRIAYSGQLLKNLSRFEHLSKRDNKLKLLIRVMNNDCLQVGCYGHVNYISWLRWIYYIV